jgi:hypothetical protein
VRVGLHHEIVALLGQVDELGAQLARAEDVTAYVLHVATVGAALKLPPHGHETDPFSPIQPRWGAAPACDLSCPLGLVALLVSVIYIQINLRMSSRKVSFPIR